MNVKQTCAIESIPPCSFGLIFEIPYTQTGEPTTNRDQAILET